MVDSIEELIHTDIYNPNVSIIQIALCLVDCVMRLPPRSKTIAEVHQHSYHQPLVHHHLMFSPFLLPAFTGYLQYYGLG